MTAAFQKIAGAWKQRTILAKLFSFASIGVVNVVIDLSVFTIALQIIHLPLVASNVVAWAVAVTGSYAMNTKITFGKETGGALSLGQYLRFAASGILGVTVATTVLVILSRYMSVPIAKLASIAAGFAVNFSMSHFVVFRGARDGLPPRSRAAVRELRGPAP
jgi:putative flippase GtrA